MYMMIASHLQRLEEEEDEKRIMMMKMI